MTWKTIDRPGFFGKKREEFYARYDSELGKDNWRLAWQWNNRTLPFIEACQRYEDGYFADSFEHEKIWRELASSARDVYDHAEADIESGLDYLIQRSNSTHLQDIAIRRVMRRRGIKFAGDELVQVRKHEDYWGGLLSPGKVRFHLPEHIVVPHLQGWWDENSIEDFYQSNKVLQVKE
jgi:hypothetical protein